MKLKTTTFLLTSLVAAQTSYATFDAHEWGTFTSLIGSNGITQNGMYHEDEHLPDFVHGFGEVLQSPKSNSLLAAAPPPTPEPTPVPTWSPHPCRGKGCFDDATLNRNTITQKMETPVIYFYTDHAQHVDVNVRFPQGVVTESYPAPVSTFPRQREGLVIANGNTDFSVDVLNEKTGAIPFVDSGNIYSHARNVASNLVRAGDEMEKFIFYRGLGRFQPRLQITSQNGDLTIDSGISIPRAAFLVHVDASGHGQLMNLGGFHTKLPKVISSETIARLSDHSGHEFLSGAQADQALVAALIEAGGLYRDEAQAMVDTWEHGYLHVPGLRMLYILPRGEVNQNLPVRFSPEPDHFVRAFVGRIEILLDTEEKRILTNVLLQGDQFNPAGLGRFAEPILRRVSEIAPPEQKALLNRLIERAAHLDG